MSVQSGIFHYILKLQTKHCWFQHEFCHDVGLFHHLNMWFEFWYLSFLLSCFVSSDDSIYLTNVTLGWSDVSFHILGNEKFSTIKIYQNGSISLLYRVRSCGKRYEWRKFSLCRNRELQLVVLHSFGWLNFFNEYHI